MNETTHVMPAWLALAHLVFIPVFFYASARWVLRLAGKAIVQQAEAEQDIVCDECHRAVPLKSSVTIHSGGQAAVLCRKCWNGKNWKGAKPFSIPLTNQTQPVGCPPDSSAAARMCTIIASIMLVVADCQAADTVAPQHATRAPSAFGQFALQAAAELAGLLRTRRGSCVSMPLIYLVIGHGLDMPVHLVTLGKHCFTRREEPAYRMNVETTIVEKVSVTPDDTVYTDGEGLNPSELVGKQMRNQTRRGVVGNQFFVHSAHWGPYGGTYETQRWLDLGCARHFAPNDPGINATHEAMFKAYAMKPEHRTIDIRNQNQTAEIERIRT